MSKNKKQELNNISNDVFKDIMFENISYIDTDKIRKQKPTLEFEYEDSLSEAIGNLKQNIELKSMNVDHIVPRICEFLEENKDEILLKKADSIHIMTGGLNIVLFRNKTEPESGKSIVVDGYDVYRQMRKYLSDEDNRVKDEISSRNFKVTFVCTLSMLVLTGYLLKH